MSYCNWHLKKKLYMRFTMCIFPILMRNLIVFLNFLHHRMRTANNPSPFQLWAKGLIECGGDDHVLDGLLEHLVTHGYSNIIIIVANVLLYLHSFWSIYIQIWSFSTFRLARTCQWIWRDWTCRSVINYITRTVDRITMTWVSHFIAACSYIDYN